jgi:penicillin-binding protein 2
MKPTLLKEFLDGEGNVVREIEPQVLWDITQDVTTDPDHLKVDAQWVRLAQEGMREVVAFGTAADYAQLENVVTGGKTGTAEYCDNIAQSRNCATGRVAHASWYVGYGRSTIPKSRWHSSTTARGAVTPPTSNGCCRPTSN